MVGNKDLIISGNGKYVQVFAPRTGVALGTSYTPTEDEVVCLGVDVTITLDSKAISYTSGTVIGLAKGVTYTLSAETDAHKM